MRFNTAHSEKKLSTLRQNSIFPTNILNAAFSFIELVPHKNANSQSYINSMLKWMQALYVLMMKSAYKNVNLQQWYTQAIQKYHLDYVK